MMSFNLEQNKKFEKVSGLLKKESYSMAEEEMKGWNLKNLALFQEIFPEHTNVLQREFFSDFWQKKRERLRVPGYPEFRFLPQNNFSDASFVTGYSCYLLALSFENNPEKYNNYLQQAMQYASIHAHMAYLNQYLVQPLDIPNIKQHCTDLVSALFNIEKKIDSHYSPAFLLLAKGYFHLALLAWRSCEDSTRAQAAMEYFWKNLHIAKNTEKFCDDAIHNAYFGKGIAAGNPFKYTSIEEIIHNSHAIALKMLTKKRLEFIESQAQQYVKNILQLDECTLESKSYRHMLS